jgi:peptidyl-prolyl cis-trans isomerase SurA
MKKELLLLTAICFSVSIAAQNIFTFGKNAVGKEEFLRAFNKNNNPAQDRTAALKEYLDLYVKFKLKVQAARDLRLDTMPNQQADLRNFRRQIEDNYMNDETLINDMVKEAFNRSQKDIRLSHILILVKKEASPADTLKAFQKIQEAYRSLQNGNSFENTAVQFSEDEAVKTNKGDLGFITVFSLPYQLESAAYQLSKGNYSAPFRSKIGYHIFKITDERKAYGKVKVQQIFFAFPPNITPDIKEQLALKADSVYKETIKEDANWDELVRNNSQDRNTVYTNGTLKEFGIGEYEPSFEEAAFSLKKVHDIARPITTAYGYHILRLAEKFPVEADWSKVSSSGTLKQQVSNDARAGIARDKFNENVKRMIAIKKNIYDEKNLWLFTDSFLTGGKFKNFGTIGENTVLFSFAKEPVKAGDWAKYVRDSKTAGIKEASKPYKEFMEDYISATTLEYYRNHLEEYNKDFKYQLQEFKEGNLLFEIMETNVWNKAISDSTGQLKYYNQHKDQYRWQSSVSAIMITASDKNTANEFRGKLVNKGVEGWRTAIDEYNGKIIADSGRFEKSQVPVIERTAFTKGIATMPVINEQDGSATFAYIVSEFKDNEVRNFEDARGMVINDYQTVLEEKWVAELKKKYPVKIDQKIWNAILKSK